MKTLSNSFTFFPTVILLDNGAGPSFSQDAVRKKQCVLNKIDALSRKVSYETKPTDQVVYNAKRFISCLADDLFTLEEEYCLNPQKIFAELNGTISFWWTDSADTQLPLLELEIGNQAISVMYKDKSAKIDKNSFMRPGGTWLPNEWDELGQQLLFFLRCAKLDDTTTIRLYPSQKLLPLSNGNIRVLELTRPKRTKATFSNRHRIKQLN
jgi:hypothetical protein